MVMEQARSEDLEIGVVADQSYLLCLGKRHHQKILQDISNIPIDVPIGHCHVTATAIGS